MAVGVLIVLCVVLAVTLFVLLTDRTGAEMLRRATEEKVQQQQVAQRFSHPRYGHPISPVAAMEAGLSKIPLGMDQYWSLWVRYEGESPWLHLELWSITGSEPIAKTSMDLLYRKKDTTVETRNGGLEKVVTTQTWQEYYEEQYRKTLDGGFGFMWTREAQYASFCHEAIVDRLLSWAKGVARKEYRPGDPEYSNMFITPKGEKKS